MTSYVLAPSLGAALAWRFPLLMSLAVRVIAVGASRC